jgi:hypothetical protein
MFTHLRGAVQSSDVVQLVSSVNAFTPQKQFPSMSSEQRQDPKSQPGGPPQFADSHVKQSVHGDGQAMYCANAGVRRLDSTGADQATAAPAPMRFSILRREIRSGLIVSPSLPSIRASMEGRPGTHIVPGRDLSYATTEGAP